MSLGRKRMLEVGMGGRWPEWITSPRNLGMEEKQCHSCGKIQTLLPLESEGE